MPSLGKMKLRSKGKQSKDKPVESQTGEFNNDKRKARVAGTTVGNGTIIINTPLVTPSANSSSANKTKMTQATSQNAVSGSVCAPLPLPSTIGSALISKKPSGLNFNPPPNSGGVATVINGPATSTIGKKTADEASTSTTSLGSIGASSNPMILPTSSITNVTTPATVAAISSAGSISNILSTSANGYRSSRLNLPPVKLTNTSGSSRPSNPITATKSVPSNTPVYSGRTLPALPPNWETRYIETLNSSSTYQTFLVDKSSSEFKVIARLLSPFRITSAEQIINPALWQSFDERRKTMLKSKSDDLDLLKGLGFDAPAMDRSAKFSKHFKKNRKLTGKIGEYSANEALLLHCTKDPANLEKIMVQGLDERLGGNGCLGKGVYFSDHPEKCVHYDKTEGTVLVFGVLLGDCLCVDKFPNVGSLVREPEKQAEQKRDKNDHFFDSITGRPHGNAYNEYVIFNRNQCYPFYLVKYMRAYKGYLDPREGNIYNTARQSTPIIAWTDVVWERVPMPSSWWKSHTWAFWPFYAASIFESMGSVESSAKRDESGLTTAVKTKQRGARLNLVNAGGGCDNIGRRVKRRRMNIEIEDEECSICIKKFDAFSINPTLWKKLKCGHRVCSGCYKSIEVSRVSMSGMPCTTVRCPFCQETTGIVVGDCPDGLMTVSYISTWCLGHVGLFSIQINYVINSGTHKLNRTAYLPKSPEGEEILELLITAWDRKLTFKIGTSMTTGQQNVLVWNIHHKTSQLGGVQQYGYPDEGYFTRVRAELKAYGIE